MSHVDRPQFLVAGIGNIFKGDDAFGVEVAKRLAPKVDSQSVRVADFGIRGIDLAYELLGYEYQLVILVDVVQRGGVPGTVYVIDPDLDGLRRASHDENVTETHNVHPAQVLKWVAAVAGKFPPIKLVACEPAELGTDEDLKMGLSEPVRLATDHAVHAVMTLIEEARCTS